MKPREILAAISTCQATCLVLFAAVAFTGWWWAGNDVGRWTPAPSTASRGDC